VRWVGVGWWVVGCGHGGWAGGPGTGEGRGEYLAVGKGAWTVRWMLDGGVEQGQ
jgi:hypothetical protein